MLIDEAEDKLAKETVKLKRYADVGLEGDKHEESWIKTIEKLGVTYVND